jgi:hypothetical protein
MTVQIFETGTGKFTPLTDDELATLNEQQVIAYDDLKVSVEALADADAEAANAKAQLNADVATLSVAERNAPPRRSFHDEWKAMTGKV